MNEYCPVCGSIDISAGRCQHCGSPATEKQTGGTSDEKCQNVHHR